MRLNVCVYVCVRVSACVSVCVCVRVRIFVFLSPQDDEKQRRFRPQWENDYHLTAIGDLGLFYEYLEMVIQVRKMVLEMVLDGIRDGIRDGIKDGHQKRSLALVID